MKNKAARITILVCFIVTMSICFAFAARAGEDQVSELVKQIQDYRDDIDEYIKEIDAKIGSPTAAQAYLLEGVDDGSEELKEASRVMSYRLHGGWRLTSGVLIADPTKPRSQVNSPYLHFVLQRNQLNRTLDILKRGRIVRVYDLESAYALGAQRNEREMAEVRSALLACLRKELRNAISLFRAESAARKEYLKLRQDLQEKPAGRTLLSNWRTLQQRREAQELDAYQKCLSGVSNIVWTRQAPAFDAVVVLPACAEPLVERQKVIDAFIAELEANETIPSQFFDRLIKWQNNFKYRRDGFDALLDNVASQIEAQSEPIPTLLKALDGEASRAELVEELKDFGMSNKSAEELSETALTAPLLATAYGAVKTLQQMRDWPNRDQNQAMYQWLLEYNENGHAKPIDSDIEGFVSRHGAFFKQFSGITPPSRAVAGAQFESAMTRYLKTYGQPLFYFFGRLEEDAPAAFPRYRITRDVRYEPGYYRKVLKENLVHELKSLNEELKKFQCAGLSQAGR